MSLRISLVGKELDLWPTPEWVARMCMTDYYGTSSEMRGSDAAAALLRYKEWVKGQVERSGVTEKELPAVQDSIRDHLSDLKDVEFDPTLVVYYF